MYNKQIVKESESMVFKAFGSSRKLSERDKRHLANFIAINSHLAQQVFIVFLNIISLSYNSFSVLM